MSAREEVQGPPLWSSFTPSQGDLGQGFSGARATGVWRRGRGTGGPGKQGGGADQLQQSQGWTSSLHVVRGLAKNELTPSSPNGMNLPCGSF